MALGGVPLAVAQADPTPNIVIESFELLPAFSGQASAQVTAVNNRGDFAGYISGLPPREFRYIDQTPLVGGFSLVYNDINDSRTAVGSTFQVFPPSALIARQMGSGDLVSGRLYYSVNNRGWIVGERVANNGGSLAHVRVDDLGETDLPRDCFWRLIDDEGRVWGTTFAGDIEQIVFKTRFGNLQNLGSLGASGAKPLYVNANGDVCGLTYTNAEVPDPTVAFAIIGDIEHHIPSETGNDARALAVTLDGQIIGSDRGLCSPTCDGKVWVVKDGVRHNLDDEISATVGFFPTLLGASAASEHGWIIGSAIDNRDGSFHLFRMKIKVDIDTDGDGIRDFWESENGGIDGNGDGVIDFRLYDLGARPDHKDLFVEVDAGNIPMGDVEVSKVLFAFDNAPVNNPDGTTGVRLHIMRDEVGLPLPNAVSIGDYPLGFKAIKAARFGTPAERADPNAAAILKAKSRVFRYCLVYDGIVFQSGRPYNGIADIGGNDLVLDFAALTFQDGVHDSDDRAATFMHELGHSLGLRHGGGTNNQAKPNYPSIMNYALAHPMRWSSRFWTLDYSREKLPTLNEASLDEASGIASSLYRNYSMPFGVGPSIAREFRLARLDGRATDFSGNGFISTTAADLNFLPDSAHISGTEDPSPGDVLDGFNDWANIQYRVVPDDRETAFDITPSEGCPSAESLAFLDQVIQPSCDADFNGDSLVDDLDFQVFVVAYDQLVCEIIDPGGGGDAARSGVGPALTQPDCPCDLNNDRFVDDLDFQIFVVAYDELLCP